MSTTIHNLIVLPGNQVRFFCADGLSPLDVSNIQRLFRFGGDLKFINCGPANEYAGLFQAQSDMLSLK